MAGGKLGHKQLRHTAPKLSNRVGKTEFLHAALIFISPRERPRVAQHRLVAFSMDQSLGPGGWGRHCDWQSDWHHMDWVAGQE